MTGPGPVVRSSSSGRVYMTIHHWVAACLLPTLLLTSAVLAQGGYRKPSKQILDVLDVPPTPTASVNPSRTHMLLAQGVRYPGIAEVAQPFLGLAGLRINPGNNGPRLPQQYVGYVLKALADGKETRVQVPADPHLSLPSWSPDGARFAFQNRRADTIELWVGETATGAVRRVEGLSLNAALGDPIDWADGRTLLVLAVPAGRGGPQKAPAVPVGPVTQEAAGSSGPVRTFQDLLGSAHDEALFEHYATGQITRVDADTGRATAVGAPAIFGSFEPSPDGRFLLVTRVKRPFSYLHTVGRFPRDIEVWDAAGKPVRTIASKPLADRVPIEGVETGPRNVGWRATKPATLTWAEALDEGDPRKAVPKRDRLVALAVGAGEPTPVTETEHRMTGVQSLEDGRLLVSDYDRDRRWTRTFLLEADLAKTKAEPKLVWSLSARERYKHPGSPVTRTLPSGRRAVRLAGDSIFLAGPGATPEGDRPFLSRFDLKTGQTQELFRSDAGAYESFVALLADDGSRFLSVHQSPTDPPNYFVREGDRRTAFTEFPDRTPELRKIKKQLVIYKRPDGVDLSFTLYLPPDHQPGTRLPTLVWAYPLEFNDPSTAGQVVGSPQRFTTLAGASHLFALLHGYAVLDAATMPVVGDPETVNDTFVEQITASAKAAVDKAVEMGVTDPGRVAVAGHSYGAFMTANLLAHSDLFRAGIARSGAYNRTLTPFGFQGERRTLWEAPQAYAKLSPFMYAQNIKEPLLLIHGQADDNPGTFPVQSERMYQAVRGNGGTVRLVLLPHESHGYAARESVEHTLFEMLNWLDTHVKNAGTRP